MTNSVLRIWLHLSPNFRCIFDVMCYLCKIIWFNKVTLTLQLKYTDDITYASLNWLYKQLITIYLLSHPQALPFQNSRKTNQKNKSKDEEEIISIRTVNWKRKKKGTIPKRIDIKQLHCPSWRCLWLRSHFAISNRRLVNFFTRSFPQLLFNPQLPQFY